jgi:hypothetical protein
MEWSGTEWNGKRSGWYSEKIVVISYTRVREFLKIVINGTPFTITEAKRKLFPKS